MIIFLFLDLMSIAEWLSLNDHDEFMNVYAAVRGSVMRKSLEQVGLLFDRTRAYLVFYFICFPRHMLQEMSEIENNKLQHRYSRRANVLF